MEKLKKTIMVIFSVATLIMPAVSIGGSLEPPAGSFDASGPLPTMKTLDQIPPTWSLALEPGQRFQRYALNNSSNTVLDKETGLVWTWLPVLQNYNWQSSHDLCRSMIVGGRMGWRLPTLEELASLLESPTDLGTTDQGFNYASIPTGVFATMTSPLWSSSSSPSTPSEKLTLDLNTGAILSINTNSANTHTICVRGGAGFEN